MPIALRGAPHHDSPEVASEAFERFRRLVLAEPELQAELRSIPDWPAFVNAAREAAARHGIELSDQAVTAARKESVRAWRERWV